MDYRNNQFSTSSSFTELDFEFDQHLATMKKYVLELTDKRSRQLCALWIQKLCESTGSSYLARKTRNAYSLRLLQILENYEALREPFDDKPPIEQLKPLLQSNQTQSSNTPDWVDDISHRNGNRSKSPKRYQSPIPPTVPLSNTYTQVGSYEDRFQREVPKKTIASYHTIDDIGENQVDEYDALSDNDQNHQYETRFTSRTPTIDDTRANSNYTQSNNSTAMFSNTPKSQQLNELHDEDRKSRQLQNDIEVQFRKIEAKFHEEKLILQQKHDNAVQKILDRKNAEIEELKSHFRKKSKEYDETIHKLERKVQNNIKEINNLKEENEKHLYDVKKQTDDILEKKQHENEKKIGEIMANFEQEKFDIQKQHTKVFQELVDETNSRLKKVEDEHREQHSQTDHVILELEKRIQMLKNEIEKNIDIKNQLIDEKASLQHTYETIIHKYNESEARNRNYEAEIFRIKEIHEQELKTYRNKMDTHIDLCKQENESLKQRLSGAKEEHEKMKINFEGKVQKIELILHEKEKHLDNANEIIKQQKIQAEKALNELKRQIEFNSNKLYDDMKEQMTKVEKDLERSKQLREKQAKDFQKQLEDAHTEYRKKFETEQIDKDGEILRMKRQFETEKQQLNKEHSDALDQMQEQFQKQLLDKNEQHRLKVEKLTQSINELEKEIQQLKEELIESNTLRKQQIVELGILREDERQKLIRESDLQVQKLKTEYEQIQQNRKQTYELHVAEQEEKANSQLKQLEKEFNERTNKQNNILQDLQKTIQEHKDENKRIKDYYEKELNDTLMKFEEERNALKKHYNSCTWQLEQDLDALKNRKDSFEKKIKQLRNEHENELTLLKLHYEEKMRGLLPLEMKRDLEDTILALKSQIQSLQQRTMLIQTELEDRNRHTNNHLMHANSNNSSYHAQNTTS